MANPMKGEASLGDHILAFNFGAFCELEERTGKKMQALLQAINEGLGFSELRDFVWAGVQTNHRGMTIDEVVALIEQQGFDKASQAVGKAVTAFFSKTKEKEKNAAAAE